MHVGSTSDLQGWVLQGTSWYPALITEYIHVDPLWWWCGPLGPGSFKLINAKINLYTTHFGWVGSVQDFCWVDSLLQSTHNEWVPPGLQSASVNATSNHMTLQPSLPDWLKAKQLSLCKKKRSVQFEGATTAEKVQQVLSNMRGSTQSSKYGLQDRQDPWGRWHGAILKLINHSYQRVRLRKAGQHGNSTGNENSQTPVPETFIPKTSSAQSLADQSLGLPLSPPVTWFTSEMYTTWRCETFKTSICSESIQENAKTVQHVLTHPKP